MKLTIWQGIILYIWIIGLMFWLGDSCLGWLIRKGQEKDNRD